MPARGWPWFAAWALAGALVVFSLLSATSIGLFVLPFALAAVLLVALRARRPEMIGLVSGAGLVALLVAFLSRDYRPCPEGPITLRPGEPSFACGGFDPTPWLVAGLVVALGGAAAYAPARRRRS